VVTVVVWHFFLPHPLRVHQAPGVPTPFL
jgi:hypothetical protein